MFLTSLDPVQPEFEGYGVEHAAATEGVAVFFHDLPVEVAWATPRRGVMPGCLPWVEGEEWDDLRDDLPRRVGLFHYRQGIPGSRSLTSDPGCRNGRSRSKRSLPTSARSSAGCGSPGSASPSSSGSSRSAWSPALLGRCLSRHGWRDGPAGPRSRGRLRRRGLVQGPRAPRRGPAGTGSDETSTPASTVVSGPKDPPPD